MSYNLDYAALREDARKIGIGLVIAGAIGTLVEDVPIGVGFAAAALGLVLILIGCLKEDKR